MTGIEEMAKELTPYRKWERSFGGSPDSDATPLQITAWSEALEYAAKYFETMDFGPFDNPAVKCREFQEPKAP